MKKKLKGKKLERKENDDKARRIEKKKEIA